MMGYAWVCVCIGLRELLFFCVFFVCVCAATDRVNAMDDCPMTTASRETVTRSGVARDVNGEDGTGSIEPALARGTRRHGNLDASGVGGSDRR